MTYDPKKKEGSNPDKTTSPADIARLTQHIRRNAEKRRHKQGEGKKNA